MEGLGGLFAVTLGVLLFVAGIALIVLQLRRASRAAHTPPVASAPPAPPLSTRLRQFGTQLRRQARPGAPPAPPLPTAPVPLSATDERRQRLQQLRADRGLDTIEPIAATHAPPNEWESIATADPLDQEATPAPDEAPASPGAPSPGELVEGGVPPFVPIRGARQPRYTEPWRNAVAEQAGYPRRNPLRTIMGVTITVALVAILIGLLLRGREGVAQAEPGRAVLAVADLGEGASFAGTGAGQTVALSIRNAVRDGLSQAEQAQMPVVAAGLVKTNASAEQEMARQHASALLWGTLPAGTRGDISATLAWHEVLPAAPWQRYGAAGRLLVPSAVPLPNQPLLMAKTLAPALQALQYYQAGLYDQARVRAETIPQDAPLSTQNLAGFIRANALLATDGAAAASTIYQSLEARGWTIPALYNNWAVALTALNDYAAAAGRLDRAVAITPATDQATLVRLYTNRGILGIEAGDQNSAQTAFDKALALDANAPDANWGRGYVAYRQGDGVAARKYTDKALAAESDNPQAVRLSGLVQLMERQPDTALARFQQALDTFNGWIDTLKADEGSAVSRGAVGEATRITGQVEALNKESGLTYYYMGLAYADQARAKPPEGFFAGAWRRLTGGKSEAEQAIAAFENAIRLDRDREDARYQMGLLYRYEGDRTNARSAFTQAKALRAADPGPYEQLAEMDLEDKKPDQAVVEYQALIAADPDYLPAYTALAGVYNSSGDTADAQRIYGLLAAHPATTGREHYLRAQALVALNRPAEAADEARVAFTADPSLWDAHLLLAKIYDQAGQPTPALQEFQAVVKQQPNNVEALYEAGRILAAQGHVDEAQQQWQKVEDLNPAHPEVHFALGGLYEQKALLARQANQANQADSWTEQAIQEYQAAVDNKTHLAEAHYHLGQLYESKHGWGAAESEYRQAAQQNADLVEAWQGLVRVLLKQPGKDADALKAAQDFQKHAPGDERAYLLLGQVFLFRGEGSAAQGPYQQAFKMQPNDPAALIGLGQAYHQAGDDGRAEQYFNAALRTQPDSAAALTGLGDLYLDQQQNGKAQDAYNRALEADPNYAPALVGLAQVLDRPPAQNGTEALKKLQRAMEIDPSYADPHYYAGVIYAERANAQSALWDQAIKEYTIASGLRPSWALPQYRLGQIYLNQKKLPEAVKAYEQATKLDPNMVEGWFELGQARRDSGNRKDAITAYQQAIKLKSDYAAAWLYLGYTLEEDGQRDQARDAFQNAVTSASDDETIRSAAQEALRRNQ
jgi:tetratricopeptide (TPR) repeat protein